MLSKKSSSELLQRIVEGQVSPIQLAENIGYSCVVDRAIAANPATPHQTLRILAKSLDKETRKNVAENVSTSSDILFELASEFPQEFFRNPLLDIMMLEDPMVLKRLDPGVLKSSLNDSGCPESLITWACRFGYKTDQLAVLKKKSLSPKNLRYIARGPHPKAAERAKDRLIEMGESW
jgi:hypothetical protein